MNARVHNWTVTLNNYNEVDMDELKDVVSFADYYIFGFEGSDEIDLHPHIHLFLHYRNARAFKTVKAMFTKQHNIQPVEDVPAMISYCKGYHKGKLKSNTENVYLEDGQPPITGVNKISQRVIDAIKEGKTIKEIEEAFPSYALHHYSKLEELYQRKRPAAQGRGVLEVKSEYEPQGEDVIYDLADIVNTTTPVVVWYADTYVYSPMLRNYEMYGVPLRIKHGYKYLTIKPQKIIIVVKVVKI